MNESWVTANGGEVPFMVCYKGRVCFMVHDGHKWIYIPERRWVRMTDAERAKYRA